MSDEEYISIVGEIFDGYTEFEFHGQTVYLKHFSIRDQRYIHQYYDKYKTIAINKGIPTEKEMLEQLREDGLWSNDDDIKIINLELELDNLKQTKLNLILPSQKDSLQNQIDKINQELFSLKTNRREIVGRTAEDFASVRSNEEFIRFILYHDKDFKKHFFTEEEFSNLSEDKLKTIMKFYSFCNLRLNEDNIQNCVLRDFFNMYLSQTEDVSAFYGKPIINLSVFQLKLALYAKVFFNIFQYNDDIPESIKKDPSALLRFAESKKNKNDHGSKFRNRDEGATAVFGATKEDLNFIDPNAKKVSLTEEAGKKGGVLTMEDMIKLMG